jgi:hypothetical protein
MSITVTHYQNTQATARSEEYKTILLLRVIRVSNETAKLVRED